MKIPTDVYELEYDPISDSYVQADNKKTAFTSNFKKNEKLQKEAPLQKDNSKSQKKIHKNRSRGKKGRFIDIYIY